uniref:60S ribosomal protein L36 n=1 Tax=Steinernema glaseri TaxID=37863 RepID=A0A1I7XYZ9_9BILA
MTEREPAEQEAAEQQQPGPPQQFTTPRALTAGYKQLPPPTTPRKRSGVNNVRVERLKTDGKLHKTARRRIF